MTDGTGTTSYLYQPAGLAGALQLKQSDGPLANDTIRYQYDKLGRLTQRTVDKASESFSYDALDRIIKHTSPLGSFSQSYLGQTGQITDSQLQKGVVGTSWQYDDNLHDRHLLDILNKGAAHRYHYTISAENIIKAIQETDSQNTSKNWDYRYDAADRLKTVIGDNGKTQYTYDNADNLLSVVSGKYSTQFSVNNLNQITAANNNLYSYDANGNLLDDGTRSYQWDAENRLIEIKTKAPVNTFQFKYRFLN